MEILIDTSHQDVYRTPTKVTKMTTFTRINEDETPSITVDESRRLSKIDPNIYGGFME